MVAHFSPRASLCGPLLALVFPLLLLMLPGPSVAGMSKTFLGANNFNPQDQPQRTYYPTQQFSRFRRNQLNDEESPFAGYPGFGSTSAFRGNKGFGGRKGGSRSAPGARPQPAPFPGFGGGPDSFLDEGTTERSAPDDDSLQAFQFSGMPGFSSLLGGPGGPRPAGVGKGGAPSTSFVFPDGSSTFGSRDSSPGFFGSMTNLASRPGVPAAVRPGAARPGASASGRPQGVEYSEGGIPTFTGAAQGGGLRLPSEPGATRFSGSSSSFFGGGNSGSSASRPSPSNNQFSSFLSPFPGSSGNTFSATGGSSFGSPGASTFGSPGTSGLVSPGTGTFGSSSIKFPTDMNFPNLFPPEGGTGPYPPPSSAGLGDPLAGGNLPYAIPDEISRLLFGSIPSTTTKPPRRVTSAEDVNRVFSGIVDPDAETADEDYEEEHEQSLRKVIPTKSTSYLRVPETQRACTTEPSSPANGRIDCSPYSGCRAVCNSRYQFPTGERRFFLRCDDGEWVVAGGSRGDHMPDCEPICRPPCQNNGICLAPSRCQCPDNWEGPTCEVPKAPPRQECSRRPPTPANSKIFCGRDECNARCHEGYHFAEGITRLTYMCEGGEWVIRHEIFAGSTPDCEPVCDPACINGGRCIAPDVCECTQEYRGDYCQYPISNCDPKKMGFNGGYNCSGEGMEFGCVLWCPEPVPFEFPAAEFYNCDYATGTWSPSPIPTCDYEALHELLIREGDGTQFIVEAETGDHSTPPPGTDAPPTPTPVRKLPGSCFTWSNSHYKSFDGKVYSFESSCPYTLLRDITHGTFSVNLRNAEDCEGVSCPRNIQLFLEDEEYLLQLSENGQPSLEYKETSLAIPGQMNGVVSERVAHFVVLKVSGLGLTLKWDMQNLVVAEISEVLWNRTAGLCGRRDGVMDNDWSYSDGSTEHSLSAFLQAWQAKLLGERCLDQPLVRHPCGRPSPTNPAVTFCSRLQTDPRFADCRQLVDVEPFIKACRWDYCSCESRDREECACQSFSAFFRECSSAGVTVSGGWRSQDLCPMSCGDGKVYNPCMAAIQARCGQPADSVRPDFCVEGCDCPAGLVLHGDTCVPAEDCPCTYRDKEYSAGDTIPNDCNSCTCLNGEWACTEVKCGSRCAVVGDPHYTTFDGRHYDFMGKCSYYLVQNADVSIEAENTPCAGSVSEEMNFPASIVGQFPSCTKSVTIRLDGTVIRLKQKREVTVNGVELRDLPAWVNGVYIKAASSLFIMVELNNGLDVWWDGQTRVYVDAPAEFRGLTAGLCGTFTDNQRDDFLTPEGDIEQNAIAFANKWKTSEKCENQPQAEEARPCETHVQNKAVAEKFCAKIKASLFAKCHLEVDPEPYYRDCLYDMCSCETKLDGCLCPILAAYSKECARKGITIDWRAEVRECGVHCTGGQKYQVCGNSCARTCLDLATNVDCQRKCVEGCNCLEGFSLDSDGLCVPITECPCVYQAKEYKPGYEMMQIQPDGTYRVCECFNTEWNCWEPRGNESVTRPPQVQCSEENHEAYVDCLPEEENTCQTMHLRPVASDLCRPGCVCARGYVRNTDTGACIAHNVCPCHHGGHSYEEGDTLNEDCNTCKCEGGQWLCTDTPCPGLCTAWGDSHYKTFDGRMYDFHGTCDYLLAKGKANRADTFEVTIQNVPCGTGGVTCAKSVTLRVGSGDMLETVEFSRNKPPPTKNLTRTIIREAGLFLFAEVSDMGLVLQWDHGTRAYLRLDPQWQGKVRGLCGNFNGDDQDDFQTPAGGSSEVSVKIFGDSWRLQNYCPESILIKDTCSLHPHRKVWAAKKCAILKSDAFSLCHSEVPVEPYIERCQFDACGCDTGGDCECLCTAIAAYVHECNIHSVYIKWRKPNLCPMQCDESCERYEPCIPTCPMENCDTLLDPDPPLCTQDACVEGCARDVCPPGQVHKSATDLDCVPKADCEKKCMEVDGQVFLEGDIISQDDCHTCTCSRKKKICRGTPCTTTSTTTTTPPAVTTPAPIPSPVFTPSPALTTTYTPARVTTPAITTPGPEEEDKDCRSGWTEWLSEDKPVPFKKNSDIEPVPEKLTKGKSGQGFCSRSQMVDIKCRAVGTHRPHTDQAGVTCLLHEGLFCQGRDDLLPGEACRNYEVSFLCDCSLTTVQPLVTTTPATPATPPPVVTPSVPPPPEEAEKPYTCDTEGWSDWFNLNFPDPDGEFESLAEIRKTYSLCPDHYISEVECRPARGGELESFVTCNKRGAMCRNNGELQYCQDYEVRVLCTCECQDGLGMENFLIPNDRITASSLKTPDDKPHAARLNADWAWTAQDVPQFEGEDVLSEWLQVDLGEVKEVTGVVTQGHPHYNQYIESFVIQFSETGLTWEDVMEPGVSYAKHFQGNTDPVIPVTNLFPEPVFAQYVRVVPTDFHSGISLRLELKGCDVKETTTAPPVTTTTSEGVCTDGWTEWMNTHTPGPGDWDDRDDLETLAEKYTFCAPHMIVGTECQAVGPAAPASQYAIVCNINNGLYCNDVLQRPDHCYDYEIRFRCDCSLTTTPPPPAVTTTAPSLPPVSETCTHSSPQIKEHERDCRKFYECAPTLTGREYVEKECGPGTFFNPRDSVCDFEFNVILIKPECARGVMPPHVIVSTTPAPCIGNFWTEWFNVSHPDTDGGDTETFENIREAGLDICDDKYIIDIQCHYYKVGPTSRTPSKNRSKGRSKGGRSKGGHRGYKGGHLDRLTSSRADFTQSNDRNVECSLTSGLTCRNDEQHGLIRKCEDYAIRVQCSCEATRSTPAMPLTTQPPEAVTTTPAVPTTTPEVTVEKCPPGQKYIPNAIPCWRVCVYYRYFLKQNGICQHDGEYAPACLEPHKRQVCPSHQYLRDKDTCVNLQDCNCRLPSGQPAPPGRPLQVGQCEVCQCVNNFLTCDKSSCITTTLPLHRVPGEPVFKCANWSSWMSVSVPTQGDEQELLTDLEETYPQMCKERGMIQCRVQGSQESIAKAGQVASCDLNRGLVCQRSLNPLGCKDYEVRVFCICKIEDWDSAYLTESTTVSSVSTSSLPPVLSTTSMRPYDDRCTESRRHEPCAMPCNRICMYYKAILQEEGWCLSDDNCAPGCVEQNKNATCPPGLFAINKEQCVQLADCNCRLSNGQALPPGVKYQVSVCEQCWCENNHLKCSRLPDCEEPSTESSTLTVSMSTPSTTTVVTFKPVCNTWSPFYKKEREGEGLILSLEMLQTREEFLCDQPINATCREASTKISAADLGQTLTCDAVEGLKCLDLDNAQDCYNYEISFFCLCEEVSAPPSQVTTIGPSTTLAPCDSWSPWINKVKPWQTDGDTEYSSLEQLQDEYSFCLQGQLADIECVEAASGRNTGVDNGLSCDVRFGFRCTNSAQDRGSCLDYKIRYYCTCETTTAITTILPDFTTPPPKCYPDKYINLLKNVDDSAFFSTRARNAHFGPASARLYNQDGSLSMSGWSPMRNNREQFLEVDLGAVMPVYGVVVAGNPLTRERVTAFTVQYSRDGLVWSDIPTDPADSSSSPKVFQGPLSPTEEKQHIFDQPTEMRLLRLKPTDWYRAIAVRLEVIGCELPMVPTTPSTTESPKCEEPMGVENGLLSDLQIVVSSVLDDRQDYYGKQNIRLNTQPDSFLSAGAWVAEPKPEQFVRFDFAEPSLLSGVVTQGRPDSPEWVESFTVRYSPDGDSWSTIKDPDGMEKVFIGNFDSNTPVENKFDRIVNARFLEVRPKEWNSNIAMRVEVLGCFHPYPEMTTTPSPVITTTQPPPPYCVSCPGLPQEYYTYCIPCSVQGEYFDGRSCVPASMCPCYKEGVRYEVGHVFESKDCEECECILGGATACVPKKCPPCDNEEKSIVTASCNCVCKPCPPETRLCPSSNFCLNETSWCDGIEDCPDDELTCTTRAPEIPEVCPTPFCPEHWKVKVQPSKGYCPQVKCEPPPTPEVCPSPVCFPGYIVVVKLSEAGDKCPEYECNPPLTTSTEPPTCEPPTCPEGYEVQGLDYIDYLAEEFPQQAQTADAVCFQYRCEAKEVPEEGCPDPQCPENFEILFSDVSVLAEPCPPYECVPTVPSTPVPCPPVECPDNLTIMLFQGKDHSTCPRYTCVEATPAPSVTTPSTLPPKCPHEQQEIVICSLNEDLYRVNPVEEECPQYACKPVGSPPPEVTTAAPWQLVPQCNIESSIVSTYDDKNLEMNLCNHILAQDKVNKDWVVAVQSNCSESEQCSQYLSITLKGKPLVLQRDLSVSWDGHVYTVAQAQRIGTSSKTFSISQVGNSIYFESKMYDFKVQWNMEMSINVSLGGQSLQQIEGLCGLFVNGETQEMVKPDGSLAHSTKEYSDSWSMGGDECKEQPKCLPEFVSKAFELCNKIMLEPFTECHKIIDPSPFIKKCFNTMCDCLASKGNEEECRCQALTRYVSKCLEKNPDVLLSNWRITTKCYKECGPGEIYQDCFRSKCEKRCETLHDESLCPEDGSCIPGCFCAPGLVRKGEKCVRPERCHNCVCEGYGDPHYTTFDRLNYTFNGECSFVAARDKDPRGQHKFQVITNNKQCTPEPVTVCTDAVTILYDLHTVFIAAKEVDGGVTVSVDKENVDVFPYRSPWLSLEQPDSTQVMAAIPDIQLEVTYFLDNFGFAIRIPSALYFNKTEGLCGNCNHDNMDDFVARDTGLVDNVDEFGSSWLLEGEPASCGIIKKEMFCNLLPPEVDPCLTIMNEEIFGKCHPVEDPIAYVSSCQLDSCGSREPQVAACHALEAYARRCADLDICLNWRTDDLCPKTCHGGQEYHACGPGCVRTCDNFEDLKKNPDDCPISSVDGCTCPEGMVLDKNTCINESYCKTCDDEGHRIGDVWQTDPCTTCECTDRGSSCSTKTCPHQLLCEEGYSLEPIPGTGDACCGPLKQCKVETPENCTEPLKPKDGCGYGQRLKKIEAPGLCPQYACVCLDPENCPPPEELKEEELGEGEEMVLDISGCCPKYITQCTGECANMTCPPFHNLVKEELQEGECCPKKRCELPPDECIYTHQFTVDEEGNQHPVTTETKKLYKVNGTWQDGNCLNCVCKEDGEGRPHHQCAQTTCPDVSDHPDHGDYQLEVMEVPGSCCPSIVRTACIDDYEVIEVGDTLHDPLNGCRSVDCIKTPAGKVEKIEKIFSCDEACALGWRYEPSPLYPQQCCGQCVQVSCITDGEVKAVGDTWLSDDLCTTYSCVKNSNDQIQIQAVEVQCAQPTEAELTLYVYETEEVPDQCCPSVTRTACLLGDDEIPAGEDVQHPNDSCTTISCTVGADGNVTRREKETTCDSNCDLGYIYKPPAVGSPDCCGHCVKTHCVDDGNVLSLGERWESEGDACYEYSCELRNDLPTMLAVKKECPYFDPECPEEEIMLDESGCCKLCNVTRLPKRDCKPKAIPLMETIGLFQLSTWRVGTCRNPNPVPDFKMCSGHCDSSTEYQGQGRQAKYVSTCYCCRPSRFEKIRIQLNCDSGVTFSPVYDNIVECQCLECGDNSPEYPADQPMLDDDTEFFALEDEPVDQ